MRLVKLMFGTLLASFLALFIPFSCSRDAVLIALALVAMIPLMLCIGVLRLHTVDGNPPKNDDSRGG